MIRITALLLLLALGNACSNAATVPAVSDTKPVSTQRDTLPAGMVLPRVTCLGDTTQSYALYIPPGGNNSALPIVYLFDPHGAGVLPVTQYRELADKYQFILTGSNNSKNGNDWGTTDKIWDTWYADTRQRLKIDNQRIYTAGFSGGAKAASWEAMNHSFIKGVIANGAGLPDGAPASNFNFSFTTVTGEGDLNMTDLVAINKALDQTTTRHRILFFNGKHEWAPAYTMDAAFAGWQLDAMRTGALSKNEQLVDSYVRQNKDTVNDLLKAGNYMGADRACRFAVSVLQGLSETAEWFRQKQETIEKAPAFMKEEQERSALLAAEQVQKATFNNHFATGDMTYWNTAIQQLEEKARPKTAAGAMNQRLLAYLSLAFYSISNRLIQAGQNDQAAHFVTLYKRVDPSNSEAWYFAAILQARAGQVTETRESLRKAITLGFDDIQRLKEQPAFNKLAAEIDLKELETNIKMGSKQ